MDLLRVGVLQGLTLHIVHVHLYVHLKLLGASTRQHLAIRPLSVRINIRHAQIVDLLLWATTAEGRGRLLVMMVSTDDGHVAPNQLKRVIGWVSWATFLLLHKLAEK